MPMTTNTTAAVPAAPVFVSAEKFVALVKENIANGAPLSFDPKKSGWLRVERIGNPGVRVYIAMGKTCRRIDATFYEPKFCRTHRHGEWSKSVIAEIELRGKTEQEQLDTLQDALDFIASQPVAEPKAPRPPKSAGAEKPAEAPAQAAETPAEKLARLTAVAEQMGASVSPKVVSELNDSADEPAES